MGNTISSVSVAASLDSYIHELGDVTYERTLSASRFLKSVRGKHADGDVAVKVYVKAGPVPTLKKLAAQMKLEKDLLMTTPNALSYQRLKETDRAIYLVRQYVASNLYDRVSTRPFLEPIEKQWIVFQLLTCVRDIHARGLHHGDIKTENVLVTSTGWTYLTDFAFFKPTYLPENDPAHFSYFFDTSYRRTCYLAPERFHGPSEIKDGPITDAMDIFSLGCVIAELFLEGTPLFDLSQLLRYRTGDFYPHELLAKIDDLGVRSLVVEMIALDPDKRSSAEEYLAKWQRKAFPKHFSTFLYGYIALITQPARHLSSSPSTALDDVLDRVFFEYDKIAFFLGLEEEPWTGDNGEDIDTSMAILSIPHLRRRQIGLDRAKHEEGAVILLTLVLATVRNTVRSATRIRACDVILALAERVNDEVKLDRAVPYLCSLMADDAPEVRAAALRALCALLSLIEILTPINAFVFPEYILPRLRLFLRDADVLVRVAYAECFAPLAKTAARFADIARALKAEGFLSAMDTESAELGDSHPGSPAELSGEGSFALLTDAGRHDVQAMIEDHVVVLLTDESSAVRRALLPGVPDLCAFFGRQKANDILLSHLITYLNDRDWLLRSAFFQHVASMAKYLGAASVEEYILPLMIQALTDSEEHLIEQVITAMTGLCDSTEVQLVHRRAKLNLITIVIRFLVHPNLWIREAVAHLIEVAARDLELADRHSIVLQQLKPHLRVNVISLDALTILQVLRRPLSRPVLEAAFTWASSPGKTLFWQTAAKQRELSGDLSDVDPNRSALAGLPSLTSTHYKTDGNNHFATPGASPSKQNTIAKSHDDEINLGRLRNLGLKPEDDWKLVVLREYIWRVSHLRAGQAAQAQREGGHVSSTALGFVPTTVLFESTAMPPPATNADTPPAFATHDIQAALREASRGPDLARIRQSPMFYADSGRSSPAPRSASVTPGTSRSAAGAGTTGPATVADASGSTQQAHRALRHATSDANLGGKSDPTALTHVHRSSGVNLPGMSSKALAEVATSAASATGQLDRKTLEPAARLKDKPSNGTATRQTAVPPARRFTHTYAGNEPTVLHLVEKFYAEQRDSAGVGLSEFGPQVVPTPLRPEGRQHLPLPATFSPPQGTLVAHIHEHTAAINGLAVAPDHAFFVTCSDDGTVKVWDTGKLERNVANRARTTYRTSAAGGAQAKVKCMTFVENSHCVAAATDTGAVLLLKIDCVLGGLAGAKYGSIRLLRKANITVTNPVSVVHCTTVDGTSTLLVVGNSKVIALDARSLEVVYELTNPPHHGSITACTTDSRKTWLLVGTSRGILDLWDLRFRIRVKSIGLPRPERVVSLAVHPCRGGGRWVYVCGGSGTADVTVWDLDKSACRLAICPKDPNTISVRTFNSWDPSAHSSDLLLAQFTGEPAAQILTHSAPHMRAFLANGPAPHNPHPNNRSGDDNKGTSTAHAQAQAHSQTLGFVVVADADGKIKMIDIGRPEGGSCVVSGLSTDVGVGVEAARQPLWGSGIASGVSLIYEKRPDRPNPITLPTHPKPTPLQQQNHLLYNHLDLITALATIRYPYDMIISTDRSGVIKVYA
ncbi:Serine/threonine-protein kinase [Savitreella phatthalungensis]